MALFDTDPGEMDSEQLTSALGRIEVLRYQINRAEERVMEELQDRGEFSTFENYTHCGICGAELTNDLDRDTGICSICADGAP